MQGTGMSIHTQSQKKTMPCENKRVDAYPVTSQMYDVITYASKAEHRVTVSHEERTLGSEKAWH
jgi:hypothetical protein